MAALDLYAVAASVLALVVSYAVYLGLTSLRRRSTHATLRARTGALDAPQVPRLPFLYGIDIMRANIKTIRDKRVLSTELAMFREMGSWTWSTVLLGTRFTNTAEPENLKTIMATDFRKWGLGWQRKRAFEPLLGEGG